LLVETRAMIGPTPQRPRALLAVLKQPTLLRLAARLGGAQGLGRWRRQLARRLPAESAWRVALEALPEGRDIPRSLPPEGHDEQPVVALFPGCVASVEDAAAEEATLALLHAAGYRVVRLPAFCCGAIDLHGGEMKAADALADRVRGTWRAAGAEHLVTVTPGCLGTLRRALPGVDVADPINLLLARADRLRFRPLARRVALHLPCTQVNVARSDAALATLLRRVPELDVQVVPRAPYCCGAAGAHMLEFPERAARLREATLAQIATVAPQQLLSSNIGCRLHLAAGMDGEGRHWPHMHPLTLLAQQLEVSP